MAKKSSRAKSVKRSKSFNKTEFSLFILAFAVVGVFTLWISLAAPHKGGSTITGPVLVTDLNSDGQASWGDTITFNVSSSTTTTPTVGIRCYQNGIFVYDDYTEFYPVTFGGPNAELKSGYWTSGAADCHARLFYNDRRGRQVILVTLDFHVND